MLRAIKTIPAMNPISAPMNGTAAVARYHCHAMRSTRTTGWGAGAARGVCGLDEGVGLSWVSTSPF